MKVDGQFHLTYCSNIHRGETWHEVAAALATSLPRVRESLAFTGPMAVGLRLSAQAAATLESASALRAFLDFLDDGNYYVPTINGFPYGAFHGERVKERVYLPDWRDPARLGYTNRLARLLASFLERHPQIEGSVSTVPGAFRTSIKTADDVAQMVAALLRHAAFLVSLRNRTGLTIALAIEPEPACYLETIADVVAFFTAHLFDERAVAAAARDSGAPLTVEDVRLHIGVCLDVCHMAVEFDEPASAVQRLTDAGIRIRKVQLSSALRIDAGTPPAQIRSSLAPFADDTYLHQVVQRGATDIIRYTDLPEALAAAGHSPDHDRREWRVHFHVPIFLAEMTGFGTTQSELVALLRVLKRGGVCPYLEVETYTWDVLPLEYRNLDVCTAIARELNWVRTTLAS